MASDLNIFCFRLMSLQIPAKENLWVSNLSPPSFFLPTYSYCAVNSFFYFSLSLVFGAFKTWVWVGLLLAFLFVSKIVAVSFFFQSNKHGGDVFFFFPVRCLCV